MSLLRHSPCSITFLALAALLLADPASSEDARDPLAGAPTGRLYVTLELKGTGRKDLSNKVEWSRLTVSRKLDLELELVVPGPTVVPMIPVGGSDKNGSGMPPGFEAMGKAMQSCGGDDACQKRVAAAFAVQMMANPKRMSPAKVDDTRYENWMVDRRGVCAKGTIVVEDEGDGVSISPPSPAAPYRFKRTGQLTLPTGLEAFIERICQAEVSVDRKQNLLSMRLGRFDIPVPVKLQGQAFTSEKSALFLESGGKIEILDQPVGADGIASGTKRIAHIGNASHNSGSTVAPVDGVLTWRFVRN
ncbi:hypothetical protein [Microvirga puerhi]|uniref:Uncharacterized protein n=1 Tax=Microvirga puerhi TaxID=2876078 RepID=A0ABS7VJ31_9HYPH|nr:hypothetical protein [Microvirga puerhi]MBZ6075514.1 hypothetical protein [Microvirga puerhi]